MTYEYLCTTCENVWEAEQSISEPPLTTCPRCGKQTAKRQVSGGAGFILKGGGWYADLYGSAPKKAAEPSGESTSGGEKKAGDAKKGETSSGEGGSTKTETSKGSGGSDGGSKGPSGSGPKGGADSSAA